MSVGAAGIAIIAVAIVVGVLAVVGLPVVLAFRHAAREREYEHAERMKALELGRILPKDAPAWSPLKVAVGMAVFAPCAIFGAAVLTSMFGLDAEGLWPSAGVVGVTSILCGTYLTLRVLTGKNSPDSLPTGQKAEFEPDSYDVVSRRG